MLASFFFFLKKLYFQINIRSYLYFLLYPLPILVLYGIDAMVFCLYITYIYLHLISPLIFLVMYLLGVLLRLWPFLFLYFIMCYYTISYPGYKIFYFFGYSLYDLKYVVSYRIFLLSLKNHYFYFFNFFSISFFSYYFFG